MCVTSMVYRCKVYLGLCYRKLETQLCKAFRRAEGQMVLNSPEGGPGTGFWHLMLLCRLKAALGRPAGHACFCYLLVCISEHCAVIDSPREVPKKRCKVRHGPGPQKAKRLERREGEEIMGLRWAQRELFLFLGREGW